MVDADTLSVLAKLFAIGIGAVIGYVIGFGLGEQRGLERGTEIGRREGRESALRTLTADEIRRRLAELVFPQGPRRIQ